MATMVKENRREKKKSKEKSKVKETLSETNLGDEPILSSSSIISLGILSQAEVRNVVTEPWEHCSDSSQAEVRNVVTQPWEHCSGSSQAEVRNVVTEPWEHCSDSSQAEVRNVVTQPWEHCSHSNRDTSLIVPQQNLSELQKVEEKPDNHSSISGEKCLNIVPITSQPLEMKASEQISDILKSDQVETSHLVEHVDKGTDNYKFLNAGLQRMNIPKEKEVITKTRESQLCDSNAYLKQSVPHVVEYTPYDHEKESIAPSAPMFEEEVPQIMYQEAKVIESKLKLQCMSIEEAESIFGGTEMSTVRAMSEREEAIVEAGPLSGPEHPLVDLLSTFKSSLCALENERGRLTCSFADEERSRSTLWKIEKLHIYKRKQCKCGTNVELRANYEHAELLKERLPVAKLKLQGLLRDIQDSYCHHQHAAILAHCQIEEFLSETIASTPIAIREALFLILQVLRVSDDTVPALPAALQRWAAALVAALAGQRDVTQLLFVIQLLFRQSRSVRWAARPVWCVARDTAEAARALALLDTLLAGLRHVALHSTEADPDEGWEELSSRGVGGGVREGTLREIDLLALLCAFPLQELLARVLLFTHSDIRDAREYEWGDARGGCDVLCACAGVRTLLAVLQRACHAHAHYARLNTKLRHIAAAALEGLACLYQSPRAPYYPEPEEKIRCELQACFTAAFNMFSTEELDSLDTRLLTDSAAKDYCLTYMIGLHDTTPREVDSLRIYTPVLGCSTRVHVLAAGARRRRNDHELARIVLDFLLQTGGKAESPSATCKGGCGAAARHHLSLLLNSHPYLRTVALYAVADLAQVATLDPSILASLGIEAWRPQSGELQAVLQHWAQRCSPLLQRLLLQLDCTPHTGLSLPAQLTLGTFLCELQRSKPSEVELCWQVLLRLRTTKTCWSLQSDVPHPDPEPSDLFTTAYALLSTSWGQSIPLICSRGVESLLAVCVRPRVAVHCLAHIMLLMAHSPESVSLTPQFTEVFTTLLNCGPTLVQRAFGRGGVSGAELLLRLILSQIDDEKATRRRGSASVFTAWLHALWRVPLRAAAHALDTAALHARDWPALDAHAHAQLQDANSKEHVSLAVRNACVAPLLAECMLRAWHAAREHASGALPALHDVLWEQRATGQRVHVDNALQKIKASFGSEELVIYRSATAALAAPLSHPAHLTLWRLFFHLYLQRPPSNMRDTAVPVGPLYFSGLIKSRTISQLIKRLQETATYHRNEAETYKKSEPKTQSTNRVVKSESITIEKSLLPALSIKDLTGESSESSDDSDLSDGEEDKSGETETKDATDESSERERKHAVNMASYHTAAERMAREICGWLEDGDRVRASPHHADIARFIPPLALEEAWKDCLSRSRPPPSEELDDFPRVTTPPDTPLELDTSPLREAVLAITRVKDKSRVRLRRALKSPIEDVDVKNGRNLFNAIDKHLKNIETFAQEWISQADRITKLDSALWELTGTLRVPRPLPPVTVPCPNAHNHKCKPTVFYIEEREWCVSIGAERAIKENRSSWVSAVRSLARARHDAPRTAAALQSLARRIGEHASAVSALERAWRAAGAGAARCPPAAAALSAAALVLAERWVQTDADIVEELVSRWGRECGSAPQRALVGALVSPRRAPPAAWPRLYAALLRAKLPTHVLFSCLSKFEMSQWSRSASAPARRELLSSLIEAQTSHGSAPSQDHSILLELLGVHTAALVNRDEMCSVVLQFARLAADGKLPPRQWYHLLNAVQTHSNAVSFDQLGYLLRELGALWWTARTLYEGVSPLPACSAHVAALMRTLVRALQAAAGNLSYQPQRVGTCTWSALQESWSAWVAPHPTTPPLLPSLARLDGAATERETEYTVMLCRFRECIEEVMNACPGCEIVILQSVFEWSTACYAACATSTRQEARLQASELLAALAALPWAARQWFYGNCLNTAVQMCATGDREIMSWCCERWSNTDAPTLLRDVTDATLVPRLTTLLYLFTGVPLPHHHHILSQACSLPWRALPVAALEDALERYFASHHDPGLPDHERPHFQVLLHACLLRVPATECGGVSASCDSVAASRDKRFLAVSTWVRAAVAPTLLAHVAGHTECMLETLTQLAPHLEESSGELEELLSRAAVIMCMEPAAAAALPVWQAWVGSVDARLTLACVSAGSALTAPAYCAALADTAIRAHLSHTESSWSEVTSRWAARSPWREPAALAARACPLAAYACACAGELPPQHAAPTLRAIQAANMDFVANEVIIAVWICYACRVALVCATDTSEATERTVTTGATIATQSTNASEATSATKARQECLEAAWSVLRAWAVPPRRSLLRLVTLQPDNLRSTAQHRVLCRLAECILAPSPEATEAFELACVAAGCNDVMSWGRSTRPARLPRLALRFYPAAERYFALELQAAPS